MTDFVLVSPESGDWEAWYMDGKLIAEGHEVRASDLLDAISNVFKNSYKFAEIDDDTAEMGFPEELKDLGEIKYY